jgi:hypothetical protein
MYEPNWSDRHPNWDHAYVASVERDLDEQIYVDPEEEDWWERALATYSDGAPIVAPTCAYLDSDLSRDELEDLLCCLYGL